MYSGTTWRRRPTRTRTTETGRPSAWRAAAATIAWATASSCTSARPGELVVEVHDQLLDGLLDGLGQPLPRLEALPLDPVDDQPVREPVQFACQLHRLGQAHGVGGGKDLCGERGVGDVEAMERPGGRAGADRVDHERLVDAAPRLDQRGRLAFLLDQLHPRRVGETK